MAFTSFTPDSSCSYFIAKCVTLENLQTCIGKGEWACRDRTFPPHPQQLLAAAHEKSKVIIIFSVNNQHGWHGYCESIFHMEAGEKECQELAETVVTSSSNIHSKCCDSQASCETDIWHHFSVRWILHFTEFSKQERLPSECTKHLNLSDGSPVNKARNWQKIPGEVGEEMCHLMKHHHEKLVERVKKAEEERLAQKESFFKHEEKAVGAEIRFGGWDAVIEKVERELGKVHLACPFGSQRYNCNRADSDSDIFLVYQAKTRDILGLDPPKQTIKNSEQSVVDYTVLELQRYCELLISGDPRCIETLYLDCEDILVKVTPEWTQLKAFRECLLTRTCFDKYMKECQGTTGLKQIQKWHKNNDRAERLSSKMNKLAYIVLRLLQSARDLVVSQTLLVYRTTDSAERRELMSVRDGQYSYITLMELLDRYFLEIEPVKESVRPDSSEGKVKLQQWLLDIRINDLQLECVD